MRTTKTLAVFQAVLIALVLESCADPKKDYEDVQKLQDAAEQVIQRSPDYDTRIRACDNAIGAIERFLQEHKEGEWSNIAQNALSSWQSRKTSLEQELTALSELLYSKLQDRAVSECKKIHPASNIEEVKLDNRATTKDGNNVRVSDTYSVRMRGAVLGTHIFKLTVRVSGWIAMDSNRVFVDETAIVDE